MPDKINDKIQRDIILAPLTTFKIGGPAKYFIEVEAKAELEQTLAWAKEQGEPYFILGAGSNLLVSDQGFAGLVIKLINQTCQAADNYILNVGAGLRLSDLLAQCEILGWSGLEWAAGIPGTVGGAVRGNAGAFGSEMKESVASVEYFDATAGVFIKIEAADCAFSYRHSLFKTDPTKIIWQINFKLSPGSRPALAEKMTQIIAKRLAGQPPEPSAGCVFKNLIGQEALAERLGLTDKIKGGKLACAMLLENLGLKGKQIGGAKISELHANFIVNSGQAKAGDVKELIDLIKKSARQKFALELEEEIQYLGQF